MVTPLAAPVDSPIIVEPLEREIAGYLPTLSLGFTAVSPIPHAPRNAPMSYPSRVEVCNRACAQMLRHIRSCSMMRVWVHQVRSSTIIDTSKPTAPACT